VQFWQAYEPIWTRAAGEQAFDPMMERASIARLWSAWMSRIPLPQAVQIIGPRFREDLCLDAAAVVGAATEALTPIDPRRAAQ
jgi:amidase